MLGGCLNAEGFSAEDAAEDVAEDVCGSVCLLWSRV
jgi:hypothetical protein